MGQRDTAVDDPIPWAHSFQHEALMYAGLDDFLAGTVPFLIEGLEHDEPMLVAVPGARLEALKDHFRADLDRLSFADMEAIGRNPAHIIPAWHDFLQRNGGGAHPVRGIGEPIWAGRSATELVECQRHESLLNVAFAHSGSWRLLCPYDVDGLPDEVIEEAQRSHPWVSSADGARANSSKCLGLEQMAGPFDAALPPPPETALALEFGLDTITTVREHVERVAAQAGLAAARRADLVLAVHEIASNSILHGGGVGVARAWREDVRFVCEVADRGYIGLPLVGRERPTSDQPGGRGVWMANQLCDLVQIRTFADGNVVRLHVRID